MREGLAIRFLQYTVWAACREALRHAWWVKDPRELARGGLSGREARC
jgi:hypothetical protein